MSVTTTTTTSNRKPRARDLGVPFDGMPGKLNGITDVAGVEVGLSTILADAGGKAAVRTGVTVILPRGRAGVEPVFAGRFALNGNGEMTGTAWIDESGFLEGPVAITNTHSVGAVHEALVRWQMRRSGAQPWALPVVTETWDGWLNDINGFHVRGEHVFAALDGANSAAVAEGNTGGGTGMVAHQFKGGTGTASRVIRAVGDAGPREDDRIYAVGALVQANYGTRAGLTIAGVPVGREITDMMPQIKGSKAAGETGSIVVIVATDAPLLPHQLRRVAMRCGLGVARNGGTGGHFSGDLFLAFSTANAGAGRTDAATVALEMLPNDRIDPIFTATIEATEEAVINAMVAAETMTGVDGNVVHALPHERLREAIRKYNRLVKC